MENTVKSVEKMKRVTFSQTTIIRYIELDREERKGYWEQAARNHFLFQKKIENFYEPILKPVLEKKMLETQNKKN